MQTLKLIGLIFIGLCASLTGVSAALSLYDHVRALELARNVLEAFLEELSYSLSPPDAIVARLARRDSFSKAEYLPVCSRLCNEGLPFPQAWREGLSKGKGKLSDDDVEEIASLSETLGRCGIEEALASLRRVIQSLTLSIEASREYAQTHGKLYRTLGMLSGVFLVILWI